MKKSLIAIAAAAVVLAASLKLFSAHSEKVSAAQKAQSVVHEQLVAGPGRIEPISEDIQIGSELSGKLKSVNVEEGDAIRRGQILAVLMNGDYRAEVLSARAQVAAREATLRKVINGARRQERAEALSSVHETEAVMNNANAEMDRRHKLFDAGVISREEYERFAREFDVSRARYREASERHSLVDDHAREEDQAMAEADLELAKANLEEAQARYEKTVIRSPIDGTVLRKHHRNGESVSNSSTVPDPIVTIGDKNTLRVRVDVDETEVSKVGVGQKAYVTADAFGNKKFWGHVVRVSEQLGPKNIRTDEPTERVDRKILETLVELNSGAALPVGLRVDAFILTEPGEIAHR
jgi:ABC exporter DevB family membrane fusion protein